MRRLLREGIPCGASRPRMHSALSGPRRETVPRGLSRRMRSRGSAVSAQALPPIFESPTFKVITVLDQHNVEIHENRAAWAAKPVLQEVYRAFYRLIAGCLPAKRVGPVVEIGSGMGNIKTEIPECVTTDLFPNPWLDRIENIYRLTFADRAVSAFILFDVFHHLRYPGTALAELRRALEIGGRVILLEPDMGALGRFIYGRFHHEPLGLDAPIEWESPAAWDPASHGYYAAQGNATRVFVRGEYREQLSGWRLVEVQRLPAFSYLGTGGFRGPQLIPKALLPVVRVLEKPFTLLPALFATRLLVVLERHE